MRAVVHRVLPVPLLKDLQFRWRMARTDWTGPEPAVWDQPIFIHVPKAAGSSIARLDGIGGTFGHKPFAYYERWLPAGRRMPMTFAVVRDPYDRFVSAFSYLQAGGRNSMDARWARAHIPAGMDAATFARERLTTRAVRTWLHFRPQVAFLHARDGTIGVQHVLKFETLAEDWPDFAARHGLAAELPHRNPSRRADTPLDPGARATIRSLYADDFARLGYPA